MQIQVTPLKESKSFKLGLLLIKRKQPMDALDRFKSILETNPRALFSILIPLYKYLTLHEDYQQLRIVIAEIYIFQSYFVDAVDILSEAIEVDPKFTQSYFILSKLYNKHVETDHIQKLFENSFELNILDSAIIDLLSKIYIDTNNIQKSIHFYEKLHALQPTQLKYFSILAELYIKTHQYDQATELYKKLASHSPNIASEVAKKCEMISQLDPMNFKTRELLIDLYTKSYNPDAIHTQIQQLLTLDNSYISKSIKIYKKSLHFFPKNIEFELALADLLFKTTQITESLDYLETIHTQTNTHNTSLISLILKILEQCPNQVIALHLLADIHISSNNEKESLPYLNTLSHITESDHENLSEKCNTIIYATPSLKEHCLLIECQSLLSHHQYNTCLTSLQPLKGGEFDLDSQLIEITCYQKLNNMSACKEQLLTLLKEYPDQPQLHLHLKVLQKAIISQSCEKKEKNAQTASQFLELGLIYLRKGDFFPALESLQKITPDKECHFKSQILICRTFLDLHRFEMTINQLNRTIKYTPTNQINTSNQLRFLKASTQILSCQFKEALSSIETIQQFDINYPCIQFLHTTLKQYNLSDTRGLAITLNISSDLPHTPYVCGIYNTEQNQNDSNQTMSFALPHNNQGVAFALNQHYSSAISEFKNAIQMDPNLTIAYCNLALLQGLNNHYEEAHRQLETAKKINADLDIIYLNKALLYTLEGKIDSALTQCQKSLKLNSDNKFAQLIIGDIYYKKELLGLSFSYWKKAAQSGYLLPLVQRRSHYLIFKSFDYIDWISFKNVELPELSIKTQHP